MPRLILQGRNRFVLLLGPWALKIPSLRCWRDFLFGLLNNQNEAAAWAADPEFRCPVLWAAPGGWLVVMRRAAPLQAVDDPFLPVMKRLFEGREFRPEMKRDSFGWVGEQMVALDYGW